MLVGDSGTWPNIVGTGGGESELGMAENWNIGKGGKERKILNNQTI